MSDRADFTKLLEEVRDEPSFVRFVEALAADWNYEARKDKVSPGPASSRGANGWEHGTIGAFSRSRVGIG